MVPCMPYLQTIYSVNLNWILLPHVNKWHNIPRMLQISFMIAAHKNHKIKIIIIFWESHCVYTEAHLNSLLTLRFKLPDWFRYKHTISYLTNQLEMIVHIQQMTGWGTSFWMELTDTCMSMIHVLFSEVVVVSSGGGELGWRKWWG